MKLFLPLLAFAAAGRQDASYNYDDYDYAVTASPMTDGPVRDQFGSRPDNQNGGGQNDGTCTRDDYNNKNKHSWRTNCPSGCGITEYVHELDGQIDDSWNKLVVSMDKVKGRWGKTSDQIHITLDELLKKLREIMANIKKERDQFLAIKKTYKQANISGILAQQRVDWAALESRRAELQIELSNKQKKFREEANFCKVSFKEYDEEVCDITSYVQKY